MAQRGHKVHALIPLNLDGYLVSPLIIILSQLEELKRKLEELQRRRR